MLFTDDENSIVSCFNVTVYVNKGDSVYIPAEVKHWHGAAKDSWFTHLALEVPSADRTNEWLEPVSDADYSKLR